MLQQIAIWAKQKENKKNTKKQPPKTCTVSLPTLKLMKQAALIIFLILLHTIAAAQIHHAGQSSTWAETIGNSQDNAYHTDAVTHTDNWDFSTIWTDETHHVIGFIGEQFQRLDIKYLSITKDYTRPQVYYVYGKSKVKNNICAFQGTIHIVKHYKQTKNIHSGYRQEGYIIANCDWYEKQDEIHSGYFKGVLQTFYAISQDGKLVYPDDGEEPASNYNNGFVGTWTDYTTGKSKPAHWGADFVPLSGDLNVAVAIGDFIPNQKYHKNGWTATQNGWVFPTPLNWWQ